MSLQPFRDRVGIASLCQASPAPTARPHVSNDNPFSEAQFKTLKYRPDFPERFASLEAARAFCQPFFTWSRYVGDSITHMISDLCVVISDHPHKHNTQHRHGGVAWLTPATVHHGHGEPVRARRAEVLAAAYAAHPERFVRQPPQPPRLPPAVWINPPTLPALPTGSHGADGLWATATIAPDRMKRLAIP